MDLTLYEPDREPRSMRLSPFAWLTLAAASPWPATSLAADLTGKLAFPVACQAGRTCEVQHYVDRDPGPGAKDYRCGPQTYQAHNGVDIRLPDMAAQRRGVEVLAAAAGRVARLRDGVADISVRAPGAPPLNGQDCGNGVVIDHGDGWETQYCHMARGSLRVKTGEAVAAGAPLGRIGLSGNTEYPHLHITVRQAGKVVDPFAPDMSDPAACKAQAGLWSPQALAQMPYRSGAVLNAGFAGKPVSMDDVEGGAVSPASRNADYLVAYGRGIALLAGDAVELELKGPDGARLAQSRLPPLDRWKAQHIIYVGKKRPPAGWPPGAYTGEYRVWRQGKVVLSRRFETRF
jgi:hypothetical protein